VQKIVDPFLNEQLLSARNSMEVTGHIISQICDKVDEANYVKNVKKKIPSRIVGEIGSYTSSLGKILNNPGVDSDTRVDRVGADEPICPKFSQLNYSK